MSIKLVQKVKRLKVGNPTAKAILLYLADAYNEKTRVCNPSQETIANDLELNRATVCRKIEFLEKGGFLTKTEVREKGKFHSFNYSLPCDSVPHEENHMTETNTKKIGHRVTEKRVGESHTNSIKENLNGIITSDSDESHDTVFDELTVLMTKQGILPNTARKMIGKLIKQHGNEKLVTCYLPLKDQLPLKADSFAYFKKCLENFSPPNGKTQTENENEILRRNYLLMRQQQAEVLGR